MHKVLIVDDELLMRIGLKSMIDWEERGFRIVGEAANGKEALDLVDIHKPELIITDIKMPVMDGLELIRENSRKHDGCQYIILSCLDEFHYAQEAVRLGAADYLIKSDIKPRQLIDALDKIQKRIAKDSIQGVAAALKEQVKEGIGYLKETLFKELISGFRDEKEIVEKTEPLNIALVQGPMILVKLKVDRFEQIRRKYVEQDEKLLRYSVVNIIEEIISRRRRREVIVENSAEYLLVMNSDGEFIHGEDYESYNRLFDKIQTSLKDFLNITVAIGVSSVATGFGGLKKAYREANMAVKSLFFDNRARIAYYDDIPQKSRNLEIYPITQEDERKFRLDVENSVEGAIHYITNMQQELQQEGYSEQAARKAYISILSLISSCYPSIPTFGDDGRTVYEQLLQEETLGGMHELTLRFLEECERHDQNQSYRPQSYAEQARAIIISQYAEDISLQTVADSINVNSSYLSRVFKQETGENFINFLTKIRIEKAQSLLKDKNIRIYEVANRVGYPNTTYFSKLFKKTTGLSPEEYRG
ncbi:AraC family transcriptional regulator [Cohnella xylanilytica]|uniref:response regulator n=1 Tax=Cohnella xylanilytica TaxID=557555 RepID=UPI001B22A38E|nr:response regulator [Cohnella xylanilytica]GIO15536.1 AraC family transcriptional regulator [Cohnella xylanilytica]